MRAAAVALSAHMHCHATPLLHSRQHQQAHHIFPTNARLRRSLASPDARATLPIRPARPLPRALAAHSACDASPPRSRRDPGVLMRMQHCACPTVRWLQTAAIGKVAAAAAAAAETCCMHTAQPARDRQGARDTRHARRRPRTRGRRSHQRCDVPAGRHADRVVVLSSLHGRPDVGVIVGGVDSSHALAYRHRILHAAHAHTAIIGRSA